VGAGHFEEVVRGEFGVGGVHPRPRGRIGLQCPELADDLGGVLLPVDLGEQTVVGQDVHQRDPREVVLRLVDAAFVQAVGVVGEVAVGVGVGVRHLAGHIPVAGGEQFGDGEQRVTGGRRHAWLLTGIRNEKPSLDPQLTEVRSRVLMTKRPPNGAAKP
jgi:hypothetical protein